MRLDWATARAQMAVCAVAATIYGMLMTVTITTPASRPLLLGLDEVRRSAPAWCGVMFVVMGALTWHCGRISAKWRRGLDAEEE